MGSDLSLGALLAKIFIPNSSKELFNRLETVLFKVTASFLCIRGMFLLPLLAVECVRSQGGFT